MSQEARLKFAKLRLKRLKLELENRKEVSRAEAKTAAEINTEVEHDEIDKPSDEISKRLKEMNYSIEEIERWDLKMALKQKGFQNFEQLAENAFYKTSSKTEVDQELYEKAESNEEMDYESQIPKSRVTEVVSDYKDLKSRKMRNLERKRKSKATSSYINDKNRQFNEKLDRHYDKYTKKIRESFERGSLV